MLIDHHPSRQHQGLQHAVIQPQQEVVRPKVRFKPTLYEKSEMHGGAISGQSYKHFTSVNYDSGVIIWAIF